MLPWLVYYEEESNRSKPRLAGQLTGPSVGSLVALRLGARLAIGSTSDSQDADHPDGCGPSRGLLLQGHVTAPDRDRDQTREHEESPCSGQAGLPARGTPPALSAHRWRLARSPGLRTQR